MNLPASPPPMPGVREALMYMNDVKAAIDRSLEAWNSSQMEDAIRSAEFFINKAKKCIDRAGAG